MSAMRKELLFGIILSIGLVLPAIADVTVEEMTDAEYLINQGYSQEFAEDAFVLKNRSNGKPIEPLYEKSQNVLVKFWRNFQSYLDPAVEMPDRIHHDFSTSPRYSDL